MTTRTFERKLIIQDETSIEKFVDIVMAEFRLRVWNITEMMTSGTYPFRIRLIGPDAVYASVLMTKDHIFEMFLYKG